VKAVLDDAGVPWANLVDVTVFLTDMKNDFPTYNRVYAEYFAGPGNPNPTRTTLGITSLPTPIAVEVKAIAVVL
jgi:2-aminomuconate deaminase